MDVAVHVLNRMLELGPAVLLLGFCATVMRFGSG
jgi:hypothetical protein